MHASRDTENSFTLRSSVAEDSSISQRMSYDGSADDACPKSWGSSTSWVKDILKEQCHPPLSTLDDDFNEFTFEKDLKRGLPSERSFKKLDSSFAQDQHAKSVTSLKKLAINTTNWQSSSSPVEAEERWRHRDENFPQFKQLFKRKSTGERKRDKVYHDNEHLITCSFEDGAERSLQHFDDQERRLFERHMTEKEEEGDVKCGEKLVFNTKLKVVTCGQETQKRVPLQQQYMNHSEEESWRELPIIVQKEAEISQDFSEFDVQQQKQAKDVLPLRQVMNQNSGLADLDTKTELNLLDSHCAVGSDTMGDISSQDHRKTLVKLDSQEG